jgi:hypothetical protein
MPVFYIPKVVGERVGDSCGIHSMTAGPLAFTYNGDCQIFEQIPLECGVDVMTSGDMVFTYNGDCVVFSEIPTICPTEVADWEIGDPTVRIAFRYTYTGEYE